MTAADQRDRCHHEYQAAERRRNLGGIFSLELWEDSSKAERQPRQSECHHDDRPHGDDRHKLADLQQHVRSEDDTQRQ